MHPPRRQWKDLSSPLSGMRLDCEENVDTTSAGKFCQLPNSLRYVGEPQFRSGVEQHVWMRAQANQHWANLGERRANLVQHTPGLAETFGMRSLALGRC